MFQKLKKNYLVIFILFLIIYFLFNLISGDRGLISFYKKKNILDKHKNEEMIISKKIEVLKDKNSLIKDKIDLDFIEILLRDKFMFGKNGDKIYMIKKYEN
tara:strand:- start:1120 stop:1422 length:303 start_codon:yes stop_codon:yes gene_type:complete